MTDNNKGDGCTGFIVKAAIGVIVAAMLGAAVYNIYLLLQQ